MPTIADLRDAFAELERQAPHEIEVLAGVRSSGSPRRRLPAPLLAAAVVLALAAGVMVALARGHSGEPGPSDVAASGPYAKTLPVTDFVFTVGPLPNGMTVIYQDASATEQDAQIANAGTALIASVTVTPAAADHNPRPPGASDVDVNGEPGYLAVDPDDQATTTPSNVPPGQPASNSPSVVWTDPSGAQISVDPLITSQPDGQLDAPPPTMSTMLAIARAVEIGQTHAVKSMAKFTYLPGLPGAMRLENAVAGYQGGSTQDATFDIGAGPGSPANLSVMLSTGRIIFTGSVTSAVSIGISKRDNPSLAQTSPTPADRSVKTVIDGYTCSSDVVDSLYVCDNGTVSLGLMGDAFETISPDNLRRIIDGMTLAPVPSNPSTWFDLADAVP